MFCLRDYTEAYIMRALWVLIPTWFNASSGRQHCTDEHFSSDWQWLAILNAIGILIVSIVSAKKPSGLAVWSL